jgi:hypothetical protein
MGLVIRIPKAIRRLKGVFLEMPGTQLSLVQTVRPSGVEPSVCESVLAALEDAHFLKRGRDGRYQRRSNDSPVFRLKLIPVNRVHLNDPRVAQPGTLAVDSARAMVRAWRSVAES